MTYSSGTTVIDHVRVFTSALYIILRLSISNTAHEVDQTRYERHREDEAFRNLAIGDWKYFFRLAI